MLHAIIVIKYNYMENMMLENRKMILNKLIRHNARGIKREIFKLMDTDKFSHAEINLILHLKNNKSLSHISKIVQIQKSNMTKLVDSLENRKILKRSRDEKDKRIIYLVLTEAGEKVRKKLASDYEKHLAEILNKVSDEEVENAITILNTIKEKIWG